MPASAIDLDRRVVQKTYCMAVTSSAMVRKELAGEVHCNEEDALLSVAQDAMESKQVHLSPTDLS